MSRAPFSIVIPTRNRPHLLPYAVASALQQEADCEIVVSDNSTSPATAEVMDGISDPRLRYVRTPRPLAMPDSWEFALGQAKGESITFLCDDDALLPGVLNTIDEVFTQGYDVATWSAGSYYHDNWFEVDRRNTVELPHTSNEVRDMKADAVLPRWYEELWPGISSPKLLNSCARRKVLEAAKARAGRLFLDPCPDVSAAVLQLGVIERYAHVDRVLMLSGSARESNGAAQWFNQRAVVASFAAEFERELFGNVPLMALVTINFVAETLLRVKRVGGPVYSNLDINWPLYFAYCQEALERSRENGADVDGEMRQLDEVLGSQPDAVRQQIEALRRDRSGPAWKRPVRRLVEGTPVLSQLRQRIRPSGPALELSGAQAGFSNILDCVNFLGTGLTVTR